DAGTFEGTDVRTCVLVATKPGEYTVPEPERPKWKAMSREEKIAQKRERREKDRKLREAADLALEDEAFTAELAQTGGRIPPDAKFPSYRPRNQALLAIQAAFQGVELTGDVRTFAAWKREGRQVTKGMRAMRIVAPMGDWADKQAADGASGDTADPAVSAP